MSLRDFNAPSEERLVILNHEPIGNGTGLSNFHTVSPEERNPNNTGKIVGALAVALMVGAGGLYAYSASANNPQPVATAANTPAPPPAQPAVMTPAADPLTTTDSAPVAPVAEPAAAPAPAPVRSARAARPAPVISDGASVRMNADSQAVTPQPSQQAAVTAIPEPVSPTPSPSDVAIANPQSSVAISPNATTAQDIPAPAEAMPQAEAAAPAQAQPEQSAGQVAQ